MKERPEKKTYKLVFEFFSNQILSGQMQIGHKLPAERELAEQLGVSRNSVREAIRMLEMMGFVESRQGSGNYICCDSQEYMTRAFNMMLVLWNTSYSSIFHMRRAMELEALRLAMENISETELTRLHQLVEEMEHPMSTSSNAKLDMEFHHILIVASQNTLLIHLTQLMSDLLDIFIADLRASILADQRRAMQLHKAHRDIYTALKQHNAENARIAMEQHFQVVSEHLQKFEQRMPKRR